MKKIFEKIYYNKIVLISLILIGTALAGVILYSLLRCKHEWRDATCIEPKTCRLCNKTDGEPLEHIWKDATCIIPKTCEVCGVTEGEVSEHTWKDATCTIPKTCEICGATEGEVLKHTWKDATCTIPKTCEVCGETEGEVLKHTWKDATCTTLKTCEVCGKTEGKLGHNWKSATYKTPKTCNSCGEIEGVAMKDWRWDGCSELFNNKYPYVTETDFDEIRRILKEEYDYPKNNAFWKDMSEAEKLEKARYLLNSFRYGDPNTPGSPKPVLGLIYERVQEVPDDLKYEYSYLSKLVKLISGSNTIIEDWYYATNGPLADKGFKLIVSSFGSNYRYLDIRIDSYIDLDSPIEEVDVREYDRAIGITTYKNVSTNFNTVAAHEQYYYGN